MSDPAPNKAAAAATLLLCAAFAAVALSVVGYAVWPSLGLQQSCPAPAKASVAKPAAKPSAKKPAAKPAPVKESKLTAKLTEMKIALSASQLPAGISNIDVLNLGAAPHELVILKTDKPADSLGSEAEVPEPGKIASSKELPAGGKELMKVKLTAGHYALICNLPGHYVAGMYADLQVK